MRIQILRMADTGGAPAAEAPPPAAETPAAPPAPRGSLLDAAPEKPAAPAAEAGTPAAAPKPGQAGWLEAADPETRAWAEAKGYTADTPLTDVAKSYRHLEQMFGADKAGRTLLAPKDETDTAALDAIYDRLGRPKDPGGYGDLPTIPGADPKLMDAAKAWFHKEGLSVKQAKGVMEPYMAAYLENEQAIDTKIATEIQAMEINMGEEKLANLVETGKAALRAAKIDEPTQRKLEREMGPAKFWETFGAFGQHYVEAGPLGADGRKAPGFNGLSPAAAALKAQELMRSPDYTHKDEKIRMARALEVSELLKLAERGKVR